MKYDIWKNIQESMMGWRYALGRVETKADESFAYIETKAGEGLDVIKREAWETGMGIKWGAEHVGEKAKEHFGSIQSSIGGISSSFQSIKLWLFIPILILVFIAIMVSIGYSGLGGPAARVAEREYARRR